MTELLDIRKVAERISMSPSWIRQAVKSGTFPKGMLRHGKTLWRGEAINAWIDREVPLQTENAS